MHKRPEVALAKSLEAPSPVSVAVPHPLEPLVMLALTTGMRHGEIAALRWHEINFEARTLEVERTVLYQRTWIYRGGAKDGEKMK
jgi:integrase